jgi:hypothetical protein
MKHTAKLILATVCLVSLSLPAAAQERYFNAELGVADVDGFDNGWVLIGGYGFQVPQVDKNFYVEGEVSATLSNPDTVGGDISYYSFGGYAVYALPVSNNFKLRGRAGLLYYNADVSGNTGGTSFTSGDDGFELSYGIGATIGINDQLDVLVDYTRIHSDINHLSAGVQYRF